MIFLIFFTIIYEFSALITGVYLVEREEDVDAAAAFILTMIPVINTVVAVRVVIDTLIKFKLNNN
jgi:hypothetical protein